MEIIQSYFTENECYKVGRKMSPKGIIVHSTGANNPYLKRYCDNETLFGKNVYGNHWNRYRPDGGQRCCHGFIGYDINKEIKFVQTLPFDYCCWNCGSGAKGSYNFNPAYIQFEICEDDLSNKEYFEKVFSVAADLCAYLCKKYNIDIKNVISHKEAHTRGYATAHVDPDHWLIRFGKTMSDFRRIVTDRLEDKNTSIFWDGIKNKDTKIVECIKKYKSLYNVKIRDDCSDNSKSNGVVSKGTINNIDKLIYINNKLMWLHLKTGGYLRYLDFDNQTKLFSEVYITTIKTTSVNCNFRKTAKIVNENIICVIPKNTKIKYVKYFDKIIEGRTWCKVKYGNVYGWIAKECINF